MKSKNKGFTLLELILVIGILGVVLVITSSFFFNSYCNFNMTEKKLELQREMQVTVNKFEEIVKPSIEYKSINISGKTIHGFISNLRKYKKSRIQTYIVILYLGAKDELLIKRKIYSNFNENKFMEEDFKTEMKNIYNDQGIKDFYRACKVNKFKIREQKDFLDIDILFKDKFRGKDVIETYLGKIYMRNRRDK